MDELYNKAEEKHHVVVVVADVSPDAFRPSGIWMPAGIWIELSQFRGIAESNQNHAVTMALVKAL